MTTGKWERVLMVWSQPSSYWRNKSTEPVTPMRGPSRKSIQVYSLATQHRLLAQDTPGMLQNHVRCTSIFRGRSTIESSLRHLHTPLGRSWLMILLHIISLNYFPSKNPRDLSNRTRNCRGYMLSSQVLNEPVREMSWCLNFEKGVVGFFL